MGLSNMLQEPELDLLYAICVAIQISRGTEYAKVEQCSAYYTMILFKAYEEVLVTLRPGSINIKVEVDRVCLWDNYEELKSIFDAYAAEILTYAQTQIDKHKTIKYWR